VQDFLYFFGHGFCHQLQVRSFESASLFFSACARDTGIYLGLAFSVLVAFVLYAKAKQKPAAIPPLRVLIVLGLLALPMLFDGVTSYAGLRPTTNTIRYVTGFLMGISVGTLLAPFLLALRQDSDEQQKLYNTNVGFCLHLALTLFLGAAFFFLIPFGGYVVLFVPPVAFVAVLCSINLLVLTLFRRFEPQGAAVRWIRVLLLALVFAIVEIAVMGQLRDIVFGLLLGDVPLSDILPS
jgi:uncharacterized membrane protein